MSKRPKDWVRWYVPCGCDKHGDHLGCSKSYGCRILGCVHKFNHEYYEWGPPEGPLSERVEEMTDYMLAEINAIGDKLRGDKPRTYPPGVSPEKIETWARDGMRSIIEDAVKHNRRIKKVKR